MRVLYLDCFSGISGDMFLSALIDAGLDLKLLKKELDKLNLKGQFRIQTKRIKYNGISSVQFHVKEGIQKERGLKEIKSIINSSRLDKDVKSRAISMFEKIHKAEKKIHGEAHHFHELGLLDTIVDVVGAIVSIKLLKIEKIFSSRVNVGSGFVKIQHGLVPVPAPATMEILKGIPIYSNEVKGELVTPTGALLLKEFVDEFNFPQIKVEKIGYGAGTKKIKHFPNLLRVMIGECEGTLSNKFLIESNIDDLNPESYEYVMEMLFKAGALDVYMTPVYMKKQRPGIMLSCVCEKKDKEKIIPVFFAETTTIGLRMLEFQRLEMDRKKISVDTEFGIIDVKVSQFGPDITTVSPEYESCKKAALKWKKPLKTVYQIATREALKKINI
ncbi:MAG: nickel pincer cofactor biosynthesis protein LarC [Spirochaetes bacterium]|nr:nickel pincer cofactor biosynthesis protein LarC [Spirochaetota bacterium]